MTKINPDPRDYRFTKKGNPYTKTDLASKIGAATGATLITGAIVKSAIAKNKTPIGIHNVIKNLRKNGIVEVFTKIDKQLNMKINRLIKTSPENIIKKAGLLDFYQCKRFDISNNLKFLEENKNFYNKINKTPTRRIAAYLTTAMIGVTTLIGTSALIGKLIGKGIDAVDNKIAANRADRMAETKEAE